MKKIIASILFGLAFVIAMACRGAQTDPQISKARRGAVPCRQWIIEQGGKGQWEPGPCPKDRHEAQAEAVRDLHTAGWPDDTCFVLGPKTLMSIPCPDWKAEAKKACKKYPSLCPKP